MFGFELISSILTAGIAAAICVVARNVKLARAPHFWASAGVFPFILGLIILILSLFWILDVVKNRPRRDPQAPGVSWLEEIIGPRDRRRRLAVIAVSTLIFVFILIPLFGMISQDYGFMGATLVFVFGGLRCFSHLGNGKVFIISALTAASVYVIFNHGLMLPMPR